MSYSRSTSAGPVRVLPPASYQVPVRPGAAVSRSDLVKELVSSERPLVVVTAPAGYGKTTLLIEWARIEGRVVVWLSLDEAHDDVVVLAQDLGTSLVSQGLAENSLVGRIGSPGTSAVEVLGRVLADSPRAFVIFLDDVHLARGAEPLALIDGLVSHVPSGSQIVVAGRAHQQFVSRRRVTAEITEIGPEQLVLDQAGVRSVFEAEGVTIPTERAAEIAARSEGWPAGVYLSALVARRHGDDLDRALDMTGSTPFVADFLLHNVFQCLDPEVQDFLLDASVLDQLHRSLCDFVIGIDTSRVMLDRLEGSNLFLVALDDTRGWYRFHSLFRDFLLAERERRRPADHGVRLLQLAATWCETNDMPDQAIEYLLRARDTRRLGPLLTRMLQPTYDEGRVVTAERWLDEAGDETVGHHPPLAVLAGWMAALTGRPVQAEEFALRMEALSFEGFTEDGWSSFSASRAAFRALLGAGGVSQMAADAELAVDGAPPWSLWRSTALWLLGQARELAGDRAAAATLYDDAVRADLDAGRPPVLVALVARALLAIDERDWATATARTQLALARAEVIVPSNYLQGALAHVAAAHLALREADRRRAVEHLDVAMAARGLGTYVLPWASVRLRSGMASAFAMAGDRSTAERLLGEIDDIVVKRPDLGALLEEVARVRRLVTPDRAGSTDLSVAELRVLGYLPTHLTFADIGKELFLSRHTVHTHAGSIYRKLGVSSRGEAVDRSRELGLFSERPDGSGRSSAG